MIVGDMEIRLRADIARLQRDMTAARQTVTAATNGMARAADAAKTALAGIGLGMGLAQVIQMSDQYTKFTAQLRLATLSTREYTQALASVKAISTEAQASLADTGVLYAKIANGTRELGNTQKQVADITEVVGLGLKVSGATATEASSAMLQLSQAFASGVLRGEEFNAVNEAGPRIMLALADGIGVPVGALKKMAENGQLTAAVMSEALPRSLEKLRTEAKEIQTISGAFQVLKDRVMEVTAVRAKDNGTVAALTQGIGLLSSNLNGLLTVMTGLTVIKAATWAAEWVVATQARITANRQLTASAIESASVEMRRAAADKQSALIAQSRAREATAAARIEVAADQQRMASAAAAAEAAIAARVAQFTETRALVMAEIEMEKVRLAAQINSIGRAARVAELARLSTQVNAINAGMAASSAELTAVRVANEAAASNAAVAGAAKIAAAREAEVLATGGAAAATLRLRLATAAMTGAMSAASLASGVLRGALALLGGPIGAVITVLTLGGLAWMQWGNKAEEASDKATAAVEESTVEMISRLDKQIEKLKERNALAETEPRIKSLTDLSDADRDGLARAKARVDAVRAGTGEFAGKDVTSRQLLEIDILHNYDVALARVGQAQDEATKAFKRGQNARVKDWFGENGTAAQKMARELEETKKKVGELTPEMEKLIRAKYVDKDAANAIKQEANAYKTLMTSIAEKIAANKLELSGYEKLTESQKATIKLNSEVGTGKSKLSEKSIASARAEIAVMAMQEDAIKNQAAALEMKEAARKSEIDTDAEAYAKISAGTKSIDDQITTMKEQIRVFGLTETAVVDLSIAKANAAMAAGPASYAELVALDAQIKKLAELRALTGQKQLLDGGMGSSVAQAKDLLEIMTAIDEATQSAAQGMASSFGQVGTAIGGLTTALSGYARAQAAVAAQLAVATKDAGGDQAKIQRAYGIAAQQSAQAQVKSYGDMANAAKGFFKEGSKGYGALQTAEKTFRAFEMAMAIKNMIAKSGLVEAFTGLFVASKATETAATVASVAPDVAASMAKGTAAATAGIANQSAGDPYSAFGRMAAMAAIMAALGFAVGGFGGSADTTAKDRQAANGTGTVFGDSSAKSDSIARSIALSAANSNIELTYTAGMLASLRNIESSLAGLGNVLIRSSGVTGSLQPDTLGTAASFTSSTLGTAMLGGPIGLVLDKITGGFVSKITSKIANAIFGGNTTSIDTGLTAIKESIGSVIATGITASQYNDTKTDGGWFHSDKYNTQMTGLGAEADQQLTSVIANMAAAIGQAGKLLGVGGDAFTQRLNSFVVDIGKISLKGLTGEEIQTALENAFSKVGDDMAKFALSGLDKFAKVGEGYLETLTRIATDYANVDSILASIGKTFGWAGTSSIAARENLIALAGGIDQLASQTSGFASNFLSQAEQLAPVQKYVTDQLEELGLGWVQTREQFKNVVIGLNLTDPAAQQTYASLMALQEAFAKTHAATVDLTKSEAEIADERADLQKQYDQLTLTSAQLRAKERAGINATNVALFDSITKLQDAATLSGTLKTSIDSLKAFRDGILSFKDSLTLGSLSTLTPMQKAAEAQRQYEDMLAKAKGGDTAAQSGIQAAATAYLTANQVINASSSAYVAASAKVQSDLAALASIAGTQLTDAQQQLAALDKQTSELSALNATASNIEAALTMPTPVLNWSEMGTVNMVPLTDEIKGLRADNDALRADNAALLAAINRQTDAVVQATLTAAANNAATVAGSVQQSATNGTWKQQMIDEVAQ